MGLITALTRQPDTYAKRKQYKFENVLGDGTFGQVKKAKWQRPSGSSRGHSNSVSSNLSVVAANSVHGSSSTSASPQPPSTPDPSGKPSPPAPAPPAPGPGNLTPSNSGDPINGAIDGDQLDVAVKIIRKKLVKGQESLVYEEMEMFKGLEHANIVKFLDFFESTNKFYLVFELAQGGELFDRICERGKFTETDAKVVVQATLSAVAYLHAHQIVHRDLKPENLLYRTRASDDLVIVDFGIAKHLASDDEVLTTVCGSPGYAAPEVLNKIGHGKAVDLWSIGVITYTLLCGYPPFRSTDRRELIRETTRARVEFHERYWKNVSDDAKDFIKSLLKPEAKDRPTAEQAMQHKWLASETTHSHDLSDGLRENWNPRRRWRSAVGAITASSRLARLKSMSEAASLAESTGSTTDVDKDSDDEFFAAEEKDGEGDPAAKKQMEELKERVSAITVEDGEKE